MNSLQEKAEIFGTIFTLSNKLQMLGDQLDPNLTVKQWLFLAGVTRCDGNETPTLSELAGRIGSSRQNVKKMALILEKQGFIALKKDGRDARILRVSLTDLCREHLKRREDLEVAFIETLFEGFGDAELAAFAAAIAKLEQNVNRGMEKDEKRED